MAADRDEKTEPATPRRRRESREQGQVARSQDLTAAVLMLMGFLALSLLGPSLFNALLNMTRAGLGGDGTVRIGEVMPFAGAVAVESFKQLGPFLLILFFSILAVLVAQIGFMFTLKPLAPNLGKINPLSGLKRLFSLKSIMLSVSSFGKLLVVGLVAYLTISESAAAIIYAVTFGLQDIFRLGSMLMFKLTMRLAAALLILALLDYAWQRYSHERDMRMTKEEVKDELKSMEGSPESKRRQRQVQLQLATQRLRRDVPTADVVVTNPTHVAVAISYDSETMHAPKVVSKGPDEVALRIRQIATEFGIPIVERPPLARSIYETVEVGEYVPEQFYRAIAEILAYVYELAGSKGATARPPLAAAGA